MLFESRHITVTADHGTATLAFGFGGEPVNALDRTRLIEFDRAIRAVSDCRDVHILLIRSASPAGFCAGLHPQAIASLTHPADRSAFAWYGQRLLDQLSELDAVSVAIVDGPSLGAGFELALACDFRLCVARPTTRLGFPDRYACFGGTDRLRKLSGRSGVALIQSGHILSGREAKRFGLVDVTCSPRRAGVEIRSILDRIESRPLKRHNSRPGADRAAERRSFAVHPAPAAESRHPLHSVDPIRRIPSVIGLFGNDPDAERIAADLLLRGASVVVCGDRSGIFAGISAAVARGFVTTFEAEEAWRRLRVSDSLEGFERAEVVLVTDRQNAFRLAAVLRPRAVVCIVRPAGSGPIAAPSGPAVPFPYPRRLVRISFCEPGRVALFPDTTTDPDLLSTLVSWLQTVGLTSVVFPPAARLLPRAA